LRILPAYLAVLAIYFLLPAWREYPTISPLWKFLVSVQNIGLRGGTSFSHAWSLAVEDQFYLVLPVVVLLLTGRPRAALLVPCLLVFMGLGLRWYLGLHFMTDTGIFFRAFQTWIYYPTWTRLDPLIFGVALAAIEKFRPPWWQRLMDSARWLWLPGLVSIASALYLSDADEDTIASAVCAFPLVAVGMATLLVCAVSPRLPFRRVRIPGAAFIASIAYSAYLVQKLVIHFAAQWCLPRLNEMAAGSGHAVAKDSFLALVAVQVCIFAAATILFLVIERPFLQLRHRLAGR
jgi:peptidoglycan/LPS O-acetylase OafA/YrhL